MIIIDADQIITEIRPEMWGVFFEDINFSADGGLYGELIKNRSFEFNEPMMGWKQIKDPPALGKFIIINRPEESNSRFIRMMFNSNGGRFGIENEGFRGIGVHKDSELRISFFSRVCENSNVNINIELVDAAGNVIGKTSFSLVAGDWTRNEAIFVAHQTNSKCSLRLLLSGEGTVELDMISLFPVNTWKGRENGLRKDLVQMLADLKPGFIRFPGGCIVEGYDLLTRYQWKHTVGPPDQRKSIINRWNTEFKHRVTPDYYQSFGLGFYEYFLLAEDLGAEPLPVINCGMACQFNTGEIAKEPDIVQYIQDALDLIEFANGSSDSKWGSLRTEMGHPSSFNMKYLGIGNEQWGEQYINIYKLFAKILKKNYPDIKLIVSSGAYSEGEQFEYLWNQHRALNCDIVDEHYYKKPEWFFENATRYDNYNRKAPKVVAGEYAAQSVAVCSADNKNTWMCALSEAAFMTGLERNADVVNMASYAPLFAHTEAWQWTPDLIYFDNLECFGSASYYVQKLFSNNRGTHVVKITEEQKPLTGQGNVYATASIDTTTKELIIKVVNSLPNVVEKCFQVKGVTITETKVPVIVLSHSAPDDYNTLEDAQKIFPVGKSINVQKGILEYSLDPYSFTILKMRITY